MLPNFSIKNDVHATPKSKMKAPTSLSLFDLGVKSPRPTVDKDVNIKYVRVIIFSLLVLESISKYTINYSYSA